MPRHVSDSWGDYLGRGALSSFLVSCVVAVAGLGVPILWRLAQVLSATAGDEDAEADTILVLGRTLENDRPTRVFAARLDHGARLWRSRLAPRIVITGGLTGRSTVSEAEAGRTYLVELGVPSELITCEGESKHTLDNLFNVRKTARLEGWSKHLVVSDPLHMARAKAVARGLGLEVIGSPAVDAAPRGLSWWVRAVREALLIHWYHCGVAYSRLIGSQKNLERVT